MDRKKCWPLLVVVMLVHGCATVREEYGSTLLLPGNSLPSVYPVQKTRLPIHHGDSPSVGDSGERAGARRAEVEWALAQMWGVAKEEGLVGTRLEFTFWARGGALTLLSWRRTTTGRTSGQLADASAFANELRGLLILLTERRTGALAFTLHRERLRWRVDYEAATVEEPPEARAQPMRRTSDSSETLSAVHTLSRKLARLLQVPSGASAHLTVDVALDDERLIGWEPGPYEATPGGTPRLADPRVAEVFSLALRPFLRGLGPRNVRLELVGMHEGVSATSRWKVVRAETLRPAPPDEAVEDILREYRQLHAEIFHRYHEEMVDTVVLAGSFTLEQVALAVIGGLIGKGLHVAFEATAPTFMRLFSRGGAESVRWFRTQLIRAGRTDQELLRRLWTKVETEGFEALSAAERNELATLLRRLEQALTKQLGPSEIKQLRKYAREDYFQKFHPDFAQTLGKELVSLYEVHHRTPMEFAHLFPMLDINGGTNLAGVARPVHQSINKVWNAFRPPPGSTATAEQVDQMVGLVDRHFGRWYDKMYDSSMSEALDAAERAALTEVSALLTRLGRGR
jgi:hypothetical protein